MKTSPSTTVQTAIWKSVKTKPFLVLINEHGIALYKSGKPVSEIAVRIGFPPNCGQNRTRRVLEQAGIYKPTGSTKPAKKKAA